MFSLWLRAQRELLGLLAHFAFQSAHLHAVDKGPALSYTKVKLGTSLYGFKS